MNFLLLFSLLALYNVALAATTDEWRRRIIYQVFTDRFARTDGSTTSPCDVNKFDYCGGTWRGLINKLDYIHDMGFTAVWISPITAQIEKSYHGYWQTNLYEVNSQFGTAQDLKDLSAALHDRDMLLMVDIVTNHMGHHGAPEKMQAQKLYPFDQTSHYHPYCNISDWQNQPQVEKCWLGDPSTVVMPDLKTSDPTVRGLFSDWIKHLVSTYSIDGLRIDSVKNIEPDFWAPFCAAAGIFCLGELADPTPAYTYPYSHLLDSITDYPLHTSLTRVFTENSPMDDLVSTLSTCRSSCANTHTMAAFSENHDNPRIPYLTSDMSLAKNALALVLLADGIPVVYQGQEAFLKGADDPGCREALWLSGYDTSNPMHGFIALLTQIRNLALRYTPAKGYPAYGEYQIWPTTWSTDVVHLRKDPVRVLLTNMGSEKGSEVRTAGFGFTPGDVVRDVLGCSEYVADETGEVSVRIERGEPVVLVARGFLAGSGVCGE